MTLAQTLIKALMDTMMGMGSVFLILILISVIISLFKFINKEKAPSAAEEPPEVITPEEDDGELIAVIMTAVRMAMAAEGNGTAAPAEEVGYIVRSVRRRR